MHKQTHTHTHKHSLSAVLNSWVALLHTHTHTHTHSLSAVLNSWVALLHTHSLTHTNTVCQLSWIAGWPYCTVWPFQSLEKNSWYVWHKMWSSQMHWLQHCSNIVYQKKPQNVMSVWLGVYAIPQVTVSFYETFRGCCGNLPQHFEHVNINTMIIIVADMQMFDCILCLIFYRNCSCRGNYGT